MRYYTSIRDCYSPSECRSFIMLQQSCLNSYIHGGWNRLETGLHFVYSRPQLKAGAWIPGCSRLEILGYDEAYRNPGRGPGSPPPPEASGPGCAVSPRTDGCDSSVPVRYGSSHRQASGCGVQQVNGLLSCGCCYGFFGPVGEREYWSYLVFFSVKCWMTTVKHSVHNNYTN